jgi:hypothetical protein
MRLKVYLVVIFILASAIFSLCIQQKETSKFEVPTPIREKALVIETVVEVKAEPVDSSCLACHYNENRTYVPQADMIAGHLDASEYCIYCHVPNASKIPREELITGLHELHKNIYSNCSICHKTFATEEIKCGNCHAEDRLKPSNGNVFVIHTPVNIGCKDCHGEFIQIHTYGKTFPDKFSFP